MRTYGKVKIAFWEDEKIATLSDASKLLALYCLTGEHSNAIGCFRLPLGYVETDLRWDRQKAESALQELIDIGFAIHDPDTQYLLLPRYLDHNPIENSRVGKMCVALVNAAMRSKKIFPALLQALLPHRYRFVLKDTDCWNAEWNALYQTLCGHPLPTCDTVSAPAEQPQHTLFDRVSDTVSHTPSDTLPHTLSDGVALPHQETGDGKPGENSLSDTVSHRVSDTVSDRVCAPVSDIAPPEPEPEPDPQPKPENKDDEDSARPREALKATDIIRAFDDAIVEVYGQQQARLHPHGRDFQIANEFLEAGATLELCRQVFLKHLHADKQKGKYPISSLAYFRTAIPDAVNEQRYYDRTKPQEVKADDPASHDYQRHSRPRSGHDAFTEALVAVVHERERH